MMKFIFASLLFIFFTTICSMLISPTSGDDSNEEAVQESGVFVLTDENFDKFLERHPLALVEFYAPWCGHCKKLAPLYILAAQLLTDKNSKVVLAKLDCSLHKIHCIKYEVKGYPTLKFFKEGSVLDYDGARNAQGIVQWLEEKTNLNYEPPSSSVLTLNVMNFSVYAMLTEIMLVEFYAPWCGHCKKLEPEYEKAAYQLARLPTPMHLVKIDGTVERDLALKYNVTGYPTLKIFRKGREFEYNGPREAEGIVQYMIAQSRPAVMQLKDSKQADLALSKDDITIIGFFNESQQKDMIEAYIEACEASRETFSNFYLALDKDVVQHMKAEFGEIDIFYPEKFWSEYEPRVAFYTNMDASREDIVKFFEAKCLPLVGQRTVENQAKRYNKRPLVVAYYTVDFSHLYKDGTQFWRQKILNVAKKYHPSYYFAVSDEDEFASELKDLGLDESSLDVNVAVFDQNNKRYIMDPNEYDEFSEENFNEFMQDLKAGRVKPRIKSQPIPKMQKGSVKVLVASNFEQIVNDESKDVLIEFYAPWCGHCKALEPIYEKLATKFKSEPNLIVAKFDTTANDPIDNFAVDGFPTIYFATSGRKQNPLKYEGGRTLDEMADFLRENAVVSFKKTEL